MRKVSYFGSSNNIDPRLAHSITELAYATYCT